MNSINKEILNPASIAVFGASNNVGKPGGKVLKNILDGNYQGSLFAVNPRERNVQGVQCYELSELPPTELAILAIPAEYCIDIVKYLVENNSTKGFIILSSGFSETNEDGKKIEETLVELVSSVNGCLIGPNCIGVLNENYPGIFTAPIPVPVKHGCDLISSSGATAVFIMEAGLTIGLNFSNVFSIGNAAQTTAEDVLEYMDENFAHSHH